MCSRCTRTLASPWSHLSMCCRLGAIPIRARCVERTNAVLPCIGPAMATRWSVLAVIDNLVKGAAGQAVQNMNIMFGLPETTGLEMLALVP